MSIRNLDKLLTPACVAVVGASPRMGTLGQRVWTHARAAAFDGVLLPVNPHHNELDGHRVHHRLSRLPQVPDLALVCTPAHAVAAVVAELGEVGTRAVVVLTPGLSPAQSRAMLRAARVHTVRILGAGSAGLMSPGLGLNASAVATMALPGSLALVSQSDSLVEGLLDWAGARGIGFSRVVALGDEADVDVADLMDFLGRDPDTRAVLLYVDHVAHARKFMSAARAAARNKPVIVLKAGRSGAGQALANAAHGGGPSSTDAVLDAAIARAGMLRVRTLHELFLAAETLARFKDGPVERLAVLTNSVAAGVMAADAAEAHQVPLASTHTAGGQALAAAHAAEPLALPLCLPQTASVADWVSALHGLLALPQTAVLVVHAPGEGLSSTDLAAVLVAEAERAPLRLLGCWLGTQRVAEARQHWRAAGLPGFHTAEEAIRAFSLLRTHRNHQQALMQTPPACAAAKPIDPVRVRELVDAALAAGREWLCPLDALALLQAAGLPVVDTRRVAADIGEVQTAAALLGYPVALKVAADGLANKSAVGAVRLGIGSAHELAGACRSVLERVQRERPDAAVQGLVVQRMVPTAHTHELQLGAWVDPVFGPVLSVGHGGVAADVLADCALALPPLNTALALSTVQRTRVARLLAGYGNEPAADLAEVARVLVAVSQLLAEVPELAELNINPLLLGTDGAVVLDARVRLSAKCPAGAQRFAIRPYPQEQVEVQDWRGAPLVLRPIRAEDEDQHLAFLRQMDPEDIRMRVFYRRRSIAHAELARLTQIDYTREMAFIATRATPDGGEETLGVVRASIDPDNATAEFGVLVRSDLKGGGLGWRLMHKLIAQLRAQGTGRLVGTVLTQNPGMLAMVSALGFTEAAHPDDPGDNDVRHIVLPLQPTLV